MRGEATPPLEGVAVECGGALPGRLANVPGRVQWRLAICTIACVYAPSMAMPYWQQCFSFSLWFSPFFVGFYRCFWRKKKSAQLRKPSTLRMERRGTVSKTGSRPFVEFSRLSGMRGTPSQNCSKIKSVILSLSFTFV